MEWNPQLLLERACDLVTARVDAHRIAVARRRHAEVLSGQTTDYLPLIINTPPDETVDLPSFNRAEQFYDPTKSLYMQLKDHVLPQLAVPCDAVPGVRADTGVINCPSIFGAGYSIPELTPPIVDEHVPKDVLREFDVPADIEFQGTMPRVIEHMEHHMEVLGKHDLDQSISVYHCDQQGPFDIAAQVRGDDIFTDMYEDPRFVHELMDKATTVYIAVSKLCKGLSGEPINGGNAVGYWMANGGVRMCADCDILVGEDLYREFIAPYVRKAMSAFEGGWLHYCGGIKGYQRAEGIHLHRLIAEIGGARGLNWSTAGNWLAEMRKLNELHLVHLGTLPREEGESLECYFRRALAPYSTRAGMIFTPELRGDEASQAMALWQRIQDERFE